MSIRRDSCDTCFKGHQKCDLMRPTCERCQRSNKLCHYPYPPSTSNDKIAYPTELQSLNRDGQTGPESTEFQSQFQHDHGEIMRRLGFVRRQQIQRTISMLGSLPPLSGSLELEWVFDMVRDCPLTFAKHTETLFIHKDLVRSTLPRPIRTAFGLCASAISMNDDGRSVLFKMLAAEMSDLLEQNPARTLLEDLAGLQAAVLYQIIRFFEGDLEQRIIAERQELPIRSYGLRLLQRADVELREMEPSWEVWVFKESIRRTVIIAFKLYTLYWAFRHGTCIETWAIKMLPVSTNPRLWVSQESYSLGSNGDGTATYGDFATVAANAPQEDADGFVKLLLTGCRGVESFTFAPNHS